MNLKSILMELYRDILKEVLDFNNIAILDYRKINSEQYEFQYKGMDIDASFQPMGYDELTFAQQFIMPTNNVINMTFSVNDLEDQALKLPLKDMLPIFNTLRVIADDYVSIKKPDILVFISTSREGGVGTDKGKDKVYELMLRKFMPNGYGVGKCVFKPANMAGFCLYKVKRKK